ncbi:MAG TPA: PPOX class F420-dependent oxidoreductase [Actinomycetota bacterium]|nr:PPOX class F420-dependent oxidoreductase [Actinomycetota bacterium]
MTVRLTDEQRAVLERTNYGHLATLMKDGSPQVTPVWVDVEGDHVLVNTAAGRLKDRNVRRDPRVAISVRDNEAGEDALAIRGRVVEITENGAVDHINRLSHKYRGEDFPRVPGQVRLILRIEPEHVTGP